MRESVLLRSATPAERSLRVTFDWRGDRYGHRVELVDADHVSEVLNSVETLNMDRWPASPPLQQLHVEDRGDGKQVALLVGMAGKEHWSASVEMDPCGQYLMFDIACRVSSPAIQQLRSTYEIAEDAALAITPLECDGQLSSLTRFGKMISISPPAGTPRTVRWKYRISLR